MASPAKINTPESVAKLWVHEASRVFIDRMTNDDDRKWCKEFFAELTTKVFRTSLPKELFEGQEILFNNFMVRGVSQEDRLYEEIADYDRLQKIIIEYINEYNFDLNQNLDLVLFKEAYQHI